MDETKHAKHEHDSATKKDSRISRLWWLWSYLIAFLIVDLLVAFYWFFSKDIDHLRDPYRYEAIEVLLGNMQFGMRFAAPGGLLGIAIAAAIRAVSK